MSGDRRTITVEVVEAAAPAPASPGFLPFLPPPPLKKKLPRPPVPAGVAGTIPSNRVAVPEAFCVTTGAGGLLEVVVERDHQPPGFAANFGVEGGREGVEGATLLSLLLLLLPLPPPQPLRARSFRF